MTYTVVYVLAGARYSEPRTANGNRAISMVCEHASLGERAWIESDTGQRVWPAGQ